MLGLYTTGPSAEASRGNRLGQGGPAGRSGSGAWTRTRDHAINSRALYQLSYAGTVLESGAGLEPATCGLQNRCSAS